MNSRASSCALKDSRDRRSISISSSSSGDETAVAVSAKLLTRDVYNDLSQVDPL